MTKCLKFQDSFDFRGIVSDKIRNVTQEWEERVYLDNIGKIAHLYLEEMLR